MQLKKNSKAFKTIKEIFVTIQDKSDRQKLIRLYITRAGHAIKDRISVESIQGDADLFYNMNYDAIMNNLQSPDRQLHESDELPGVFFFHSTSNKTWDETPFEFDESIKKEFAHLNELPTTRKREKSASFALPKTINPKGETRSKPEKKLKTEIKKVTDPEPRKAAQPDYGLKHQIEFTNLAQVVFRGLNFTKKDILDYYNMVAGHLLPYLKDKALTVRAIFKSKQVEYATPSAFPEYIELPDWSRLTSNSKTHEHDILLCNDKDHLLLFAELGGIEFDQTLSRVKNGMFPDYTIIAIESPDSEVSKAVDVALAAREILNGLRLPSFVKSDGLSGLHIYIPLDSKSKYEASIIVGEYLCKMIRIKRPDDVALEGSEDNTYGRVSLKYALNDEEKHIIAPYSLTLTDSPTVAVPLYWDELTANLQLTDFNVQTIGKRLRQKGDPFEALFKKKANADELLERLEENYKFLF